MRQSQNTNVLLEIIWRNARYTLLGTPILRLQQCIIFKVNSRSECCGFKTSFKIMTAAKYFYYQSIFVVIDREVFIHSDN